LVGTRTDSERGKLPPEDTSRVPARAASRQPAAEQAIISSSTSVEKCVNCEYYDRRHARPADGKAPMWGQCRRHSPHINPVTAKAYVVEGVWPLVRDDDWCGEWKVLTRTIEPFVAQATAPAQGETPVHSRPAFDSAVAETPMRAND
jgi:hypothetical protein